MRKEVLDILSGDLNRWQARMTSDLTDAVVKEFLSTREERTRDALSLQLAQFLAERIESVKSRITQERQRQAEFVRTHVSLRDEAQKLENMLEYSRHLGATPAQLRGDRRAIRKRWMDHHALVDRFEGLIGDLQRELTYCLDRFHRVACLFLENAGRRRWNLLAAEAWLLDLIDFEADSRVATAATRSLAGIVCALPEDLRESVPSGPALSCLYRTALDHDKDIWQQWEALSALREISLDSFLKAATWRLSNYGDTDDIFLRRRLVVLLTKTPEAFQLRGEAIADVSPHVVQGLGENLYRLSDHEVINYLPKLAVRVASREVRAATILGVEKLKDRANFMTLLADVLVESLENEVEASVARIALLVMDRLHGNYEEAEAAKWRELVVPGIRKAHVESEHLAVRRWAAQTLEKIRWDAIPASRKLKEQLRQKIGKIRSGKTRTIRIPGIDAICDSTLGRILAVLAENDFGLDVQRIRGGLRVTRGPRFGFRWWRFWHELAHPSPDKRQGYHHTIGRIFEGDLRVPSPILCEMSPTKVPG
ncbi:MAG: hypothetical protein HKN23_03735, partial [Verrucomicrobiales bacterium]|nr:hypothetical protein [Verrucomicrobiales bacterium]